MDIKLISSNKSFGGYQKVFEHFSPTVQCNMKFGAYLPPAESENEKFPVLFYLSGLTCTEQNVITKSGYQRFAAQYKIIVVCPDTSPRNCNIPNEDEKWNVGSGASMYVNAQQEPWNKHYQMFTYITDELYQLVQNTFPVIQDKISISGHSMGGHGALLCALLCPGKYKSVSLFAPVCSISNSPTLIDGLKTLVGEEKDILQKWDTTFLVKEYDGPEMEILIHVGSDDEFLIKDLLIDDFVEAANKSKDNKIKTKLFLEEGYDHGYYFISTFIEEHFKFHSSKLS
ncbi:S-formylglutathione hydrolase, partial [Aphis craccivora]